MSILKKLTLAVFLLGPAMAFAASPAPDPAAPAKELFGHVTAPSKAEKTEVIGNYAKGCIAGAQGLPINGPQWQVMRLSRNRNWGHPDLINFLENFAGKVPQATSWRGILVGDMSQPRGGPMLTGHASHQVGLDADIWLNPMPDHILSTEERENISAVSVVAKDWNDIDPAIWTPDHLKLIRLAAQDKAVERILVNPAIKQALCREVKGDRSWLSKVRPYWGHHYHMHVRLRCPEENTSCVPQAPPPKGDGCDASLAWWFSEEARKPKPPEPPKPPMPLSALPAACRQVLTSPAAEIPVPMGQATPVPPRPQ